MAARDDQPDRGVEVWSSASWREQAVSWMDAQLAAAGIERTGEVEQPRVRAWGTLLTAPTIRGPVWLKAPGPRTDFEVALYEPLYRTAPDRVLAPLAADRRRGWILLPDGGTPLGEILRGTDLVDALTTILPSYGQLQRDLAPQADALVDLGVTDMRAAVMPCRFDEALDAAARYVARCGGAADRQTFDDVAALRDTFAGWCDRLADAPGPASLDHNDLHPGNVLVIGVDAIDDARFYDWGDSVVAHPFASMLVPLGWARRELGLDLDAPEVARMRDAYLEVFSDLASHTELVETLELACHVGKAARALVWDRALGHIDAGDHAGAPLECLRALLSDSYLGGA